MARKTIATDVEEKPQTVEDKLDEIIGYLHRMERRDRARMVGSYIHGMIWLASILLLFWSTWYFIVHGPQMIEEMTNTMIQQSMGIEPEASDAESSGSYMQMLEEYLKGQ
jgi:hypothetical protein